MRQRLGIAAALLGDPPVLMLDEPFNGMDPEGIVWMRGFLRSLAAQGRAVLVSSHLMSELQDTADHLVIVGRGQVIADTSTADLLAAASGDRVTLRTPAAADATAALERAGAAVAAAGGGVLTVSGLAAGADRGAAQPARRCRSPRSPRTARAWKRPTWSSPATRSSTAPRLPGRPSDDDDDRRRRHPAAVPGRGMPGSAGCCGPSGPSSGPSAAG